MSKQNPILIISVASALTITLFSAIAAEKKVDVSKLPPPSDKKGLTYAKDIKPIFEKSCFKCHGPDKQKSKLRLDSLEAVMKGGENGPDVLPGKSAESTLVHNVAQIGDEDEFMPPPDNKDKIKPLDKEQIGLIRAWIDQGAK